MSETENIMNQSSSTWRHSSRSWSFTKAQRFSMYQKTNTPYYSIKDNFKNKTTTCSLGKGQKYYIPIWERKKSAQMPPPNKYNIKWTKNKLFGKFGKQDRFMLPRKSTPGPGRYDISQISVDKITIKDKLQIKQKQRSPGPKYLFKDPHQTLARNITLKPRARVKTQFCTPSAFQYRIPQWPQTASFSYCK